VTKIKFTKGELKRQRDALDQFRHYLPTLQLKKQQLQMKISEAKAELKNIDSQLNDLLNKIEQWSGLLSDKSVDLKSFVTPKQIMIEEANIAGANVPLFKDVLFEDAIYDFYGTPLWIDQGIISIREMTKLLIHMETIKKQIEILAQELRVTTQRVNLFEKIKIPECIENIRRIRIYLGDQQANAVGIGKVAKGKIEEKEELQEISM